MKDSQFDQYVNEYQNKIEEAIGAFGQDHDFFLRSKADLLLSILGKLGDARSLKVLDVGCGIGLLHRLISPSIGEIYGTDVSLPSLSVAASTNEGLGYALYDGSRLPFMDETFDCTFAVCVMHHVAPAQWNGFVSEMARVVRKGGVVVIFEHNPLNPATQWVVRNCELDADAVLLPSWRLKDMFRTAHLTKVECRHILFTPFSGKLFRRIDQMLSWVPLGTQYFVFGQVTTEDNPPDSGLM